MPTDNNINQSPSNTPLSDTDFELRSEQVQEILTKVPHWMIRWGNLVIFILLILVFLFSYFMKYPDINTAEVTVTTIVPPEKLTARTSGRIEAILVENNQNVEANTPLAVIENTANYKDVFLLKSIIDTLSIQHTPFPFNKVAFMQLGEVENAFALFQKEYSIERLQKELKPYQIESTAQSFESRQLSERLLLLESQRSLTETELTLQKKEFERYEKLFENGVVAEQEFEKQRMMYLQSQKNYKNLLTTLSQLRSSLNELNKNSKNTSINQKKDAINLERNVLQAFFLLKKALKDWELNYVLRTSIKGNVSFLKLWAENQTVVSGDQVFTVVPFETKGYVAKAKALAQNSGKIKVGQKVNIRLANFPDTEYGILKGSVQNISATPDSDGNYLIDIALPEGLKTSYNKAIDFQQEMTGSADIITEDLRLIERFFYQFRNMIKR